MHSSATRTNHFFLHFLVPLFYLIRQSLLRHIHIHTNAVSEKDNILTSN